VTFTPAVIACEGAPAASSLMTSHNRIEIVLPDGLRLIADATLDAGVLAGLVGAIKRR
jgi:hypothetical protein